MPTDKLQRKMRIFHKLIMTIALMLLLALLLPSPVAAADEVVTFPDPNLEAAIRKAIGKPSGGIYQADLEGITSLSADHRGIADLTGLEYCASLSRLIEDWHVLSNIKLGT